MLMMTRTSNIKKHPTPKVPEESGMEAYRHFGA